MVTPETLGKTLSSAQEPANNGNRVSSGPGAGPVISPHQDIIPFVREQMEAQRVQGYQLWDSTGQADTRAFAHALLAA